MTAQTYQLPFEGYWRESNIRGLPTASGIYCVCACTNHVSQGTVTLDNLIYNGESENVRVRVAGHEKWPRWRRYVGLGKELCFSCARIFAGREQTEAAMIFEHKPPENTEYVHSFPYGTTTIFTSGRNTLLRPSFTVFQTEQGLKAAARW